MTLGFTIADDGAPPRGAALRARLRGVKCDLAPLGREHTAHVIRWRNDPDIASHFLTAHRFEAASHEAWLARTLAGDQDFNWAIIAKQGEAVGTVGLYNIDWSEGRAEFGRLLLGESNARGKGLALEATRLVLRAAGEARLWDIHLEVLTSNAAARALYVKAGFHVVDELGETLRMRTKLREGGASPN